jgi:hypothetical protein
MSDLVLVDGDKAVFERAFGSATVIPRAGRLKGSGSMRVGGKVACVEGDEGSVRVEGCSYSAKPFVTPGVGTLTIKELAPDQLAASSSTRGGKLMAKGGSFIAEFSVTTPATQPSAAGPIPDPIAKYLGTGSFVPTNGKTKAG